jgi:serine/threonine protein kinase
MSQGYCNPRNENRVNQKRLEDYIFGKDFNIRDIDLLQNNNINVHIQQKGFPSVSNCFFFSFTEHIFLKEGSLGDVYKVTDQNKQVSLALKATKENDEEVISNALLLSGCNVLKMRFIGRSKRNQDFLYLMELAEGDLKKFCKNHKSLITKQPDILLTIIESIREQMVCILNLKKGYVYTDMKLDNILYKCDDPANLSGVRFMLGDLGSAVSKKSVSSGNFIYIATYPPLFVTRDDVRGFFKLETPEEKKKATSWGLGVLSLLLYSQLNITEVSNLNNDIEYYLTSCNQRKLNTSILTRFSDHLRNFGELTGQGTLFMDYFSKIRNIDSPILVKEPAEAAEAKAAEAKAAEAKDAAREATDVAVKKNTEILSSGAHAAKRVAAETDAKRVVAEANANYTNTKNTSLPLKTNDSSINTLKRSLKKCEEEKNKWAAAVLIAIFKHELTRVTKNEK